MSFFKVFRISAVFSLGVAFISGFILYSVSRDVRTAELEVYSLQNKIEKENEAIRVLQAEWYYLNNPERLENLAGKYMDVDFVSERHLVVNAGDLQDPFIPAIPVKKPFTVADMRDLVKDQKDNNAEENRKEDFVALVSELGVR